MIEIFRRFGAAARLESEIHLFQEQARAYLAKKCVATVERTDKGPTWHRKKAFEWLVASHNQLEHVTGIDGWSHFQLDADASKRPVWSEWPTATVCIDQGSDGWCACNFLKAQRACMLLLKDPSHRKANHCKGALHDSGVWPVMVIASCVHNSDSGPWGNCRWYREGIESVHMYMQNVDHKECPLFKDMFLAIVKDLQWEDRMNEDGIEDEVWKSLPEAWLAKLPKISMNRWFALTDELPKLHKVWHRRLLGTLINCVRNGLMQSKPVLTALRKSAAMASSAAPLEMDDVPKETVQHEPEALKSLRAAAKNQLELNACVLSDNGARLLTVGVCALMKPFRAAHTVANLACRSTNGAFQWMLGQAKGDCFTPLPAIWALLADAGQLGDFGLACHGEAVPGCSGSDPLHPAIASQNQLASRLTSVAVSLTARNFHDVAYHMRCFPGLFPLLTSSELCKQPLAFLKEAHSLWEQNILNLRGQFWAKYRQRSIFNDIYVQKILAGIKAANFEYSEEVARVVARDFSCIGGSQIDEDSFRHLRTVERLRSGWAQKIKDKRKYSTLIESRLECDVHAYKRPRFEDEPIPRGIAYAARPTTYQPALEGLPKFYLEIIGRNAQAPWYSPAPLKDIHRSIDLALAAYFGTAGEWHRAKFLWLAMLLRSGQLLVSHDKQLGPRRWYFALAEYGHAGLAWPAEQVSVGDAFLWKFKEVRDASEVKYIFVHDLEQWQAQEYEWLSPAAVHAKHSVGVGSIFASPTGAPGKLIKVAAGLAFGNIAKAGLLRLALFRGCEVDMKCSLFKILKALIQMELPNLTDDAVGQILLKRVKAKDVYEEFLSSEDLLDHGLDDHSMEEVQEAASHMKQVQSAVAEFSKELKAFRNTCRPQAAPRASKKGGKPSSGGTARKAVKLKEQCTETDAQVFMPPGHRIWRDSFNACWRWYWQGARQLTRSWAKHGYVEAAILLVQLAWQAELNVGGEACPWKLDLMRAELAIE